MNRLKFERVKRVLLLYSYIFPCVLSTKWIKQNDFKVNDVIILDDFFKIKL